MNDGLRKQTHGLVDLAFDLKQGGHDLFLRTAPHIGQVGGDFFHNGYGDKAGPDIVLFNTDSPEKLVEFRKKVIEFCKKETNFEELTIEEVVEMHNFLPGKFATIKRGARMQFNEFKIRMELQRRRIQRIAGTLGISDNICGLIWIERYAGKWGEKFDKDEEIKFKIGFGLENCSERFGGIINKNQLKWLLDSPEGEPSQFKSLSIVRIT